MFLIFHKALGLRTKRLKMILRTAILFSLLNTALPRATISNNGYEDIVVAISPDVWLSYK